jgi:hypothetical protein
LLFAAAFIPALMLLDWLYTFGLDHNRNLKITSVSVTPPAADLLFHGPCEPLWMISPAIIDRHTGKRSYNLALSHSDFADNYLHLYLYLKSNPAPGKMFLFVTPESFDKRFNTFNTYRFAYKLDDPVVREVVKENDPQYSRWTFIPFMRYAYYNRQITFRALQGWKHFLTNRGHAYYPDGFEPPAKRVWGNHAGDFARLYKENTVFSIDSLRVKYLDKIIALAKQKNITVYLYESPVLRESLPTQKNRNTMVSMIRRFADREKINYIQFDSLELSKSREYFISTLSLNMQGVAIFNDTLGKYIRTFCNE